MVREPAGGTVIAPHQELPRTTIVVVPDRTDQVDGLRPARPDLRGSARMV